MADSLDPYPVLSSEAISRALIAKKITKLAFDQPNYTPGSLASITIPSIPSLLVPSKSWFQWKIVLTVTPTAVGNKFGISQNFPHSAIQRVNVLTSSGATISNIQNYDQIHRANALLDSIGNNTVRLNLGGINDNTAYIDTLRSTPFIMNDNANFPNTAAGQFVTLTVETNMATLPVFNLDALLPLNELSSNTTAALKAEFQLKQLAEFITVSADTLAQVTNCVITPTYFMTYLNPDEQLSRAISRMVASGAYLVPVSSYFSVTQNVPVATTQQNARILVNEESVTSIVVLPKSNVAFSHTFDAVNCFSSGSISSVQFVSGSVYYPALGPIMRDLNPNNNRDAVDFFSHIYNVLKDRGQDQGVMINPTWFNNVAYNTSYDFHCLYSFANGTKAVYSGANVRLNGAGAIDTNVIFASGGAFENNGGQLYIFAEFQRVYVISSGGMSYIDKQTYLNTIAAMSPEQEIFLNQLLNISKIM